MVIGRDDSSEEEKTALMVEERFFQAARAYKGKGNNLGG